VRIGWARTAAGFGRLFDSGICLVIENRAVEFSGKEILSVIWDWIVSTATGDCKEDSSPTEEIVLRIRMPRIVLAALIGASLSLSGTVYQALFRNRWQTLT